MAFGLSLHPVSNGIVKDIWMLRIALVELQRRAYNLETSPHNYIFFLILQSQDKVFFVHFSSLFIVYNLW